MFDYYEDKKNNKIKIGYRFIFQSNKKTLTDEEINMSVENLIEPILSINSLTIPGLWSLNKELDFESTHIFILVYNHV